MTNTLNKTEISTADSSPKVVVAQPKNALVHGIYATDLVQPWESEEDLERLHQDLVEEWAPEGRMEEETVLDLTRLRWLKHRVMRSSQMAVRSDPLVRELEASGAKTWSQAVSFLKDKAAADDGVMGEARETLALLKDAVKKASAMMTVQDKNTHEIFSKVEGIQTMFLKQVLPVYGKAFEKVYGKESRNEIEKTITVPLNAVEATYCPSYLERIVRLEASLDARIDKTLNRLSTLKEYKRLAKSRTPKQIASPSIAASTSVQSG
jgi:hypothetical protein